MFGYRVPAPDEAMLISGGRVGSPAPRFGWSPATARSSCRSSARCAFLTLAMCEAEVQEACVTRQGIALNVRAVIAFKVGNDSESIVNAAPAIPVRPGPDVGADRPDLRRPSALDHRLDDRRGDHHRAAEAGHRGARRLQGGDGQDRPDRRLVADPVDRRQGPRLHRGDGRPAQRGHPAGRPRSRRPRPTRPRRRPSRSPSASRPSTPGRPRSCRRSTRPRWTARRPRPPRPDRWPRRRPSARSSRCRPNWPSAAAELRQQQLVAEVVRPAEAEAERVRILALADAEKMQIQAEAAASQQPGRPGPDAHRPAAGDRQAGGAGVCAAPTSTSSTARTASARSQPGWSARD